MDAELEQGATCCEVCGGLSFETSDSLFFCLECGTQSQDIREEEAGEDVEPSNFVRTLKAPSTKKKSIDDPIKRGGDITLLQKLQLVLQRQCGALISLGYDISVKEAVKCIWFLYLKKCGYAFVDDPGSEAAAPMDSPAPVTPLSRKRPRHSDEDPLPIPKRPRVTEASKISCSSEDEEAAAAFDEFPEDNALFECSQDSSDVETSGVDLMKAQEPELSGNDLFLLYRARRQNRVRNFSVHFTIGVLYLGLQYTHQKILLSDLKRLVATNRIPYHNLHTVLPSQVITPRHSTSLYAKNQTTSDKIHSVSQSILKFLPLPELPQIDPKWVCHILLERLQLPGSFHLMLENALARVYWPDYHKGADYGFVYKKRLDLECMALIIFVVKMVYRLDDVQEFEQASKAVRGKGKESLLGTSGYVYPWEDWVTLFCRNMQHTLDAGVPLNERELGYVSNKQPFLDFCREEIFPNVRPKERPGEAGRRHRYHPEFYARVSEVFKKHREKAAKSEKDSHQPEESRYSWDDFSPRLIPCSVLLAEPENAPWKQYIPIPATSKDSRLDFERLPKSMVLLLELCADVVDASAVLLMECLRHMEWYIIQESEHAAKITTKIPQPAQESADEEPQDSSATEEPQDSSDEEPQDSSDEEPQDSSATEEPQDSSDEEPLQLKNPKTLRMKNPKTLRMKNPKTRTPSP